MAEPFDPRNTTLGYATETLFGVTPVAQLQLIPFQSWNPKQPTDTVISQTIRTGRAPIDLLRTSLHAEATLGFEMIAAAYDAFFEQSLMSAAWATQQSVTATDISFQASDDSVNSSAGAFSSFAANKWVHISGFTGSPGQNGFYKIVTKSNSKLTLVPGIASDDAAGESVTVVQGPFIEDGNTFRSMLMEAKHDESTDMYHFANGMSVSEAALNMEVGAIVNGSFTMMGTKFMTGTVSEGSGAPLAATTNLPMTAVDHVASTREGPTHTAMEILGQSFAVNNNLGLREIVGTLGPAKRHRADLFEASGSARIYLTGPTEIQRFYDFDTWNFASILRDGAGNAYVFDFPAVKFSDADFTVQTGQDLTVTMPWNAFDHPTEGVAMRVSRFTSLP